MWPSMFYFLFLVFVSVDYVEPAKILVVTPTQMRSHYIVVEELLRHLAESGHQITVVSQFHIQNPPPNYREIVIDIPPKSFEGNELRHAIAVFKV